MPSWPNFASSLADVREVESAIVGFSTASFDDAIPPRPAEK
jgi:hypothetical protein